VYQVISNIIQKKMKIISRLLIFFSALLESKVLSIDTGIVDCTDLDDGIETFEVCYTTSATAVSGISMYENGTSTAASQRFSYSYTIWNLEQFYEVESEDQVLPDGAFTGISIAIGRSGEVDGADDRTECDYLEISGGLCASCSYCGNDTYSADCTNLPFGRAVECEPNFPLYFPLTADGLLGYDDLISSSSIESTTVPSGETTPYSSDYASGVSSSVPINCPAFSYNDTNFEVCNTASFAAISGIGMFENGTQTPASQVFWYNFTIYNKEDLLPLFLITMERSGEVQGEIDRTECEYVAMDGEACSSCSYCGNEKFSADCTNLPNGRIVQCESINPVFFPFTSGALVVPKVASFLPSNVPSDVPSNAPSNTPSIAPSNTPSETSSNAPSESPTFLLANVTLNQTDIKCNNIYWDLYLSNDGGMSGIFEICATTGVQGSSSISRYENGTETPAQAKFSYNYSIYDIKDQVLPTPMIITIERSGEVDENDNGTICNFIDVNGEKCTSCGYCENEMFSANCTNLEYGRLIECEPSLPLFIPFTADALLRQFDEVL
jgi:hypothetical protein